MELITVNQPTTFARQLRYKSTKHVIDIVLCLLILPIDLPIMAICALAV
jgi:lipopolysaccharide/colanic/teichoic acid biosynthesis glycosyltransferase